MTLRSPIGRARGLGSAKEGVKSAWSTIATSIGLIPLSIWFVFSLVRLNGATYEQFVAWASSTCNVTLLITTIILVLYHSVIGLKMVIEDYVQSDMIKYLSLVAVNVIALLLGVSMTVSILKVAVGA